MTCRVNKAVSVEIGMNLNHPNVFSGVTQRLQASETVAAYAVTVEKDFVRKVDPRGSIVVLASPAEREFTQEKELLQYNLKCPSCPLKVVSSYSVEEKGQGEDEAEIDHCTIIIRQEFTNTSDVVDLSDIQATIGLPSNDSVVNWQFVGDNQMKFHLNSDTQSGVCSCVKLKRQKVVVAHLKFRLTGVNVNRFHSLDKQLQDGVAVDKKRGRGGECMLDNTRVSFTVQAPKKNNSPNISTLSGFHLRYINILDKTVKIHKTIAFETVLQGFEASFRTADSSAGGNMSQKDSSVSLEEVNDSISNSNGIASNLAGVEEVDDNTTFNNSPDYSTTSTSVPPTTTIAADETNNSGNSKFVPRPWGWEADAALLEDLYDSEQDPVSASSMGYSDRQAGEAAVWRGFSLYDERAGGQRGQDDYRYDMHGMLFADDVYSEGVDENEDCFEDAVY